MVSFANECIVSVGGMENDSNEMRGVLDRSFAPIKLPFHRDCTAQDMLRKCRANVWPGAKDTGNYRYSLADGSGLVLVIVHLVLTFQAVGRSP